MAVPDCMLITVALPWKDDTNIFHPTPMSNAWKDMVAEAGLSGNSCIDIYVSADSSERMQRWKNYLECHISRNHPKY